MRQCMDAENLHRRLKKIIGQVQAIDRMIDEDVPCEDILSQINAAKSALNGCGKVVLEGHIRHCVRDGIEHAQIARHIVEQAEIAPNDAAHRQYQLNDQHGHDMRKGDMPNHLHFIRAVNPRRLEQVTLCFSTSILCFFPLFV